EDERREHVDEALQFRPDIGVNEVDRDVPAAVRRCGDAPEDQDAQKEPSEVVAVGDLDAEEVSQQDRGEDIGGDDADEERRHQLDPIDEAVHAAAPDHDLRCRLGFGHDAISCSLDRLCAVEHARERAATSSAARVGCLPAPAAARTPPFSSRDGLREARRGEDAAQYAALYWASDCLSSFMMAAGSPPALRTLSVHCFSSGSADFFHSSSCASVIV